MIAIIGIRYRIYIPIIPYIGVVFPFMTSLSSLFLDNFEGNANISLGFCHSPINIHASAHAGV